MWYHEFMTRSKRIPLSKTEWWIMNLCWRLGKSTARQVHDAALEERTRDYRTVKTLLDRIAAKGYLKIDKVGPICLYSPEVGRGQAFREAVAEFVDTVLDHTVAPLYVHLAEQEGLSEAEIAFFQEQLAKERAAEDRREAGEEE